MVIYPLLWSFIYFSLLLSACAILAHNIHCDTLINNHGETMLGHCPLMSDQMLLWSDKVQAGGKNYFHP